MADSKLQIWHCPNPPREGYRYPVRDIEQAKRCLIALAEYDLFLGDGEDGKFTTVGRRREKRLELQKKHKVTSFFLKNYEDYLKGMIHVFANAQGLETFEDEEWVEWYDDETGSDISELMREAS